MDLGVIGGFSYLGKEYKENPFEIVYAVDNDEYCTKIYNDNFAHKCVVKDVRDIIMTLGDQEKKRGRGVNEQNYCDC